MEGFMVTCPLAPSVPHLLSSSCSSPRAFGWGFLQTPPRDDALALFLAFGSANTWRQDFHLTSSVPCPAHTFDMRRWPRAQPVGSRLNGGVRLRFGYERLLHKTRSGPMTVLPNTYEVSSCQEINDPSERF